MANIGVMSQCSNRKVLEVIVATLDDATEAEAGGADRLEIVRDLHLGGLTPELEVVREITSAVSIPARVMLRGNSSYALQDRNELHVLRGTASHMVQLGVDGVVTGFAVNDTLDLDTLRAIATAVPELKITFHRAFESLSDPLRGIALLKTLPQVDRILTTGGSGSSSERMTHLRFLQQAAALEIKILAAAGLEESILRDIHQDSIIHEAHIGRAARTPAENGAPVSRSRVAHLKGLLA